MDWMPTWHEIVKGLVIFLCLWVPKRAIDTIFNDTLQRAHSRKLVIRDHVYSEHQQRLKNCSTDQCAVLSGALEGIL